MSRVVVVPIAVMAVFSAAVSAAGSAIADPPPTQVINAVAVGPSTHFPPPQIHAVTTAWFAGD